MGFFSKFESKVEDTFEGAADKMIDAPISPVQIAKKAEKQMRREKMVGAGKQYAPTLYTVLVNPDDDERWRDIILWSLITGLVGTVIKVSITRAQHKIEAKAGSGSQAEV